MNVMKHTLLLLLALPIMMSSAYAPTTTTVCPVTIADKLSLPAEVPPEDIWGRGLIHNGEVGVLLAWNGAIVLRQDSMGEKISWWKSDADTNLTASARNTQTGEEIGEIRLDAYASYLEDDHGVFLMSGITFPSDGCWELIATGDDSELVVTVLVIALPNSEP